MCPRGDWILRKWAFLYSAAAIAVVGCGGSGTGNSHSSGTPGNGKTGVITVKLSNSTTTPPGAIEVAYLTGQGRAPGDLTAVVQQLRFNDAYGEVTNPLAPLTTCPLAGFQDNIVRIDVPFTTTAYGLPSRVFTSFILDFLQFDEETDSPAVGDFTILSEPIGFPKTFPAAVRVLPGRVTSLPVFIDDSMFSIDATNPLLVDFNANQFELANGLTEPLTTSTPMKAFLSDFVSFNLNSVPAAQVPVLLPTTNIAGGTSAVRVFFSGDVYGVADASNNFEALTLNPFLPVGGRLGPAGILNGANGTLPHAGTYSLLQYNPTDLTQTLQIVAGQGIWREHKTVLQTTTSTGAPSLLGAGAYVISFPSSSDNNMQELVAFVQDANQNISTLYYGFVDMDALTFFLYPVSDIMSGSTAGQLTGVIPTVPATKANPNPTAAALYDKSGNPTTNPDLVRTGGYQFNSSDGSATVATGLGFTGTKFTVFRL